MTTASSIHDLVMGLDPGQVVSWTLQPRRPGGRRFTYVAYLADNGMFFTTATVDSPVCSPQLSRTELANLLNNLDIRTLYLATEWQGQDEWGS